MQVSVRTSGIRGTKEMKACKEICQECCERHDWKWNKLNERDWYKGEIWCPPENGLRMLTLINKKGEIPEKCLCALEHIVLKERPK